MATKKKKQATRKPFVKQVIAAVKAKPKVRAKARPKSKTKAAVTATKTKRKTIRKRDRRALPRPAFLDSIAPLQGPDGRWAVHISTNPDEPIDNLIVSVNGRSVWEGKP